MHNVTRASADRKSSLTYPPGGDRLFLMAHAMNSEIVKRLKRANGHLNKVIEMFENGSNCVEITQQLQAVSSAIYKAKRTYIHEHVEHCLQEANDQRTFDSTIKELKEVTKYL